ncbi:tubulin epsilon and delta complex protein 1 isoform X2 [Fukomys damarensis]|uniref:tubulin epsilon and delta complex protein 1 isoform X2 n=1 Tax=Fukomys damarensis TaxID=885580 RepID=UPI0005401751|nr:tubulin epsilon and delta complex protein 1 isoform X2 [Fukomys damarensis]
MEGAAAAWTGAEARTLPEAIAILSRSLPDGPSPEIFRRAKFNRPEAAPALWRLLFRVLSPLREDCAAALLGPGDQAHWVKVVLHSYGYPRPALAQLPEDGSQGSRELLLAFSWLMARGPLLEWVLSQTCMRLGDQVPTCECEALASPGLAALQVDAGGSVDLRFLQWLMGKLRFRWRSLICSQQEQCALLSKIHTYTRGCHRDQNLGHLSVTETKMLRDPEGSQKLLQALEQENARLEAALEWRRYELVFWKWMDPRAWEWGAGTASSGAAGPAGGAEGAGAQPAPGLGDPGTVSAGAGQAGRSCAATHLDSATWMLRSHKHTLPVETFLGCAGLQKRFWGNGPRASTQPLACNTGAGIALPCEEAWRGPRNK